MDVNKTPVFDAMKSLFLPYRDVWQQQPVEKASSSRLKYSEIDTRFPLAPQDCIAMWIADMDIAPSRDIVEGVADYVKQSVGYQAMSIGEAVSTWFNNQNAGVVAGSTQILPEYVVGVASVIGAVNLALSIWCEPGDSVMVCTPTYGPLLEAATLNNLCVEKVSLLNGEIDPSSLSPSASAMVLWLNTTRNAIAFNRQLVTRFFEYHQINANATMGQAGFFLWINLREAASCEGENAKHFSPAQSAGTCISRGVIGNDGSQFDAIGHIRLNLACHPLHVERALNRLYFLD
jgi:bifunctional pyridoxal-dependent enzyme with beta-cystathionase and maltose regulon repressor activities